VTVPRRKAVVGVALALGSAAGAFLIRQRTAHRTESVALHFSNGTMVALEPGHATADALLELGRTALGSARD
jgi:hypothetical protein